MEALSPGASGGDSAAVQHQLQNVQEIVATAAALAFAAVLVDGSIVTWGDLCRGGDSTAVQEQLRNVQQVSATAYAFAAILADRTVVTWGDSQHGGNSSRRNRLSGMFSMFMPQGLRSLQS